MKVVINNILPFKGYVAIALWPFIFCRKELSERDLRHEEIHGKQQVELLLILFYLLYGLMWLVEVVRCCFDKSRGQNFRKTRNVWQRAYRMIPFEREAYANEHDKEYLSERSLFAWVGYMD